MTEERKTGHNSTYPKGGYSSPFDNFVVQEKFVLLINFCGKLPALRVASNRYVQL